MWNRLSRQGGGAAAATADVAVAAVPALANKTPAAAKRPAGSQFMTQSTRKRAKGASVVTVAVPEAASSEGESIVPRVLENGFGEEGEALAAPAAAAAAPPPPPATAPSAVVKPKLGLAGAVGTLFSPVFNMFGGGAGVEAGGEELRVDCATEEEMDLEELAASAPASEEEEDEEDFDPFLFISTLPPLHRCVPANRPLVLPRKARRSPCNTLVLDLDETLVHSTLDASDAPDFSFPVDFNNQQHMVNVRRRPELAAFMERVSELFEVVIFTASQRVYAERLLDIIDPGARVFRHRIFRDSCVVVDGNYLKDLTVLGRDLARTIIVDNSPQAFGFQLENGIPIESWFDDPNDRELSALLPLLERLATADDVRPIISSEFRLAEKVDQIRNGHK